MRIKKKVRLAYCFFSKIEPIKNKKTKSQNDSAFH
jgi:hypothetical protein